MARKSDPMARARQKAVEAGTQAAVDQEQVAAEAKAEAEEPQPMPVPPIPARVPSVPMPIQASAPAAPKPKGTVALRYVGKFEYPAPFYADGKFVMAAAGDGPFEATLRQAARLIKTGQFEVAG